MLDSARPERAPIDASNACCILRSLLLRRLAIYDGRYHPAYDNNNTSIPPSRTCGVIQTTSNLELTCLLGLSRSTVRPGFLNYVVGTGCWNTRGVQGDSLCFCLIGMLCIMCMKGSIRVGRRYLHNSGRRCSTSRMSIIEDVCSERTDPTY